MPLGEILMSRSIIVPEPGVFPPDVRPRVEILRQDLNAALQRGELVKARDIRQSLIILAIWYPGAV